MTELDLWAHTKESAREAVRVFFGPLSLVLKSLRRVSQIILDCDEAVRKLQFVRFALSGGMAGLALVNTPLFLIGTPVPHTLEWIGMAVGAAILTVVLRWIPMP